MHTRQVSRCGTICRQLSRTMYSIVAEAEMYASDSERSDTAFTPDTQEHAPVSSQHQQFFTAIQDAVDKAQPQHAGRHVAPTICVEAKLMGCGAFGNVYHVAYSMSGEERSIVVKKLKDPDNQQQKCTFKVEKEVLEKVAEKSHPNLMRPAFKGYACVPGTQYLMIEYCHGGDLFDFVSQYVSTHKKGMVHDLLFFACNVFMQLCSALHHLHAMDVAHGDVKMENILLHEGNAVLSDFGLCKPVQKDCMIFGGSMNYLAPETSKCDHVGFDTTMADVWSAGVVLFVMLYGTFLQHQLNEKANFFATCREYNYYHCHNSKAAFPSKVQKMRNFTGVDPPYFSALLSTLHFNPASRKAAKDLATEMNSILRRR